MDTEEHPSAHVPWVKRRGRPPAEASTATERICPRHGRTKFHRYQAGKAGHRWKCKRCVGEAVTRRHQKIKRTLVAEAGGCCAVCGYDRCIINLCFHRVDPSLKSFHMSVGLGKALDTYREEAKKCALVCANCHGEIESGQIASPPPGARYTSGVVGEPEGRVAAPASRDAVTP